MKISKIILFTLSACPMGRSMGTVLREVQRGFESIQLETVFVDVHTEKTNHYRVKKNPTTLFLDSLDEEIYRLEAFVETEHVIKLIDAINDDELENKSFDENQSTEETYTIYLFKDGATAPQEVVYTNVTSVCAPRITAVKLQIKTQLEGYHNPFPSSSELELVYFHDQFGEVILNMSEEDERNGEKDKMRTLLKNTLSHFGIKDVEVTISNHSRQ